MEPCSGMPSSRRLRNYYAPTYAVQPKTLISFGLLVPLRFHLPKSCEMASGN